MKVFYCPMSGGYSGGGIMVAAETKEQAFLTAARDKKTSYAFSWWVGYWEYIDDDGNIEHLHSDDYPLEEWREMEHLQTDLTEPQVILENGYNG